MRMPRWPEPHESLAGTRRAARTIRMGGKREVKGSKDNIGSSEGDDYREIRRRVATVQKEIMRRAGRAVAKAAHDLLVHECPARNAGEAMERGINVGQRYMAVTRTFLEAAGRGTDKHLFPDASVLEIFTGSAGAGTLSIPEKCGEAAAAAILKLKLDWGGGRHA